MIKHLKQKRAVVKYVGDENVFENIIHINERKRGKKREDIKYERLKKIEHNEDDRFLEHYVQDYFPENFHSSSELHANGSDIAGRDMFPLATSKVSQVTLKAANKQKSKKCSIKKVTPKAAKYSKNVKIQKVSVKEKKSSGISNGTETTPYQLRRRIKQELANLKESNEYSDFEDEETDDNNDDSDPEAASGAKHLITANKQRAYAEDYFIAHKHSKSLTSNHTLSKVHLPQLNVEMLEKLLSTSEYHVKEKMEMFDNCHMQFKKWMVLMREGFGVLLYGVGSKCKILQTFCEKQLEDNLYLVVHGFFPSLTVKQILCSITEDVMNHGGTFSNLSDHAEFIKEHFISAKEDLYVIVHNIDGTALRGMKNQSVLSLLAATPHIHFLASIDHINAPLIWDQTRLSQFNWVWYDVTTFEPYIVETSYEKSLLNQQSGHLVLSSLLHVYRSLTPNGRGVFLILAKDQIEEKDLSYLGLTFHEWYERCREAFLVNSELTMKAQLTEFKDHKLLFSRKSSEGIEHLYIPVDKDTLAKFLEKEGEKLS